MIFRFIFCLISFKFFCTHGVLGLNDPCTTNANCSDMNAICKDAQCICDKISYSSPDKCLPYITEYQSYCEESKQCEWLGDNSTCFNNVCVCIPNFRWYQGKCQKYVNKGENCVTDIDCFDGMDPLALSCNSGKCSCSTDYYDREYDCRKKSKENNNCAIDLDCMSPSLVCNLGKCTKTKSKNVMFQSTNNYNFEESYIKEAVKNKLKTGEDITCSADSECKNMMNSICDVSTNTCRCKSHTPFNYEGNCLPGFATCSEDSSCTSYRNTECFHELCVCKPGFFTNGTSCIPELGMMDSSLKSTSDCVIKPAKFQNNACFCLDYWFGDNTNRNCIKTTLQQTFSCLTNDWCNAMGFNSFCNSKNQCQCDTFANFNSKNFYCEGANMAGICLRDSDCPFNERCKNQKCVCIENFFKDDDLRCEPGLGGSCENNACSSVENSECIQSVCTCKSNYMTYKEQCLKIATNWNDPCEVSLQCEKFKYTECGHRKTCTCITGYKKIDGKCWQSKDYGDPCMNEEECTKGINSYYQCRNSKCLCPIGENLENDFCIASSVSYFQPSVLLISLLLCSFILIKK